MNNDIKNTIKIKLVLLGSSNTGKTSILLRYVNSIYDQDLQATIGAAFFSKQVVINNTTYILDIWDTAGQERYESLIPMYYRGAQVIFIVYDITSLISFNKAIEWITHVKEKINTNPIIILIGNKSDLKQYRQVQYLDAGYYADNNKILFYETSAKNNDNINIIFNNVIELIQQKNLPIDKKYEISINNTNNTTDSNIYNCFGYYLY